MHVFIFTVLSSILSFTAALEERALNAAGGWGLLTTDASLCPPGTQGHIDIDVTICCQTGYISVDTSGQGSRVCCPPGTNCLDTFLNQPSCADPTWSLWNATLESPGLYFCCLAGQQGEQTEDGLGCTNGTLDTGFVTAQSVGQSTPTGTTAATTSKSTGSSSTGTSQSTGTGSGISQLQPTTSVTSTTSHSGSRRIEPSKFTLSFLSVFGWSFIAFAFFGDYGLVVREYA